MKYYLIVLLLFLSTPSHAEQALPAANCNKSNVSACMGMADRFFDVEKFEESLAYYKSLCSLDVGKGCRRAAWIYSQVLDSSFELIEETNNKACSLGDMTGCNNLGSAYENNNQINKANALYRQACDGGNDLACNNLAVNFENGLGLEENYNKSAELYIKSCGFAFAKACKNAGDLYYYKFKDYKTALKWYKKACELGSGRACYDTAYQYKEGEGTKENIAKANTFYRKACELNDAKGCTALGKAYMDDNYKISNIKKDYSKGVALFERSCKMGHGSGCYQLGSAYANGYGVQQSDSDALQFYHFGCAEVYNYSGSACYNAGWYHETGIVDARNVNLAKQYYAQGCESDHNYSCKNVAALDNPLFVDDANQAADPKVVFITQEQFNGDLGGSAGADAKFQAEADAPNSKVQGRVFKAWISGARKHDSVDAKRTLSRSKSSYQLADGSSIAKDFKSLVKTKPERFINMHANGKTSSERITLYAWSGLSARGETLKLNCSDWHSSSADDAGAMGDALEPILWSDFYQEECSEQLSLYCVEQ